MNKLLMLVIAIIAVSCSKGGGGSTPDANTAAAVAANSFCAQSANQYANPATNPYGGTINPVGYGNYGGYRSYGGIGVGFSAGFSAGGYAGYPGVGYGSVGGYGYNACSEQVTTDFCNVVLVNCGITQNGSQLYSTACKNQFQGFQNAHPGLSCSYNRYGVYGTLDNMYLQGQINALSQMGY